VKGRRGNRRKHLLDDLKEQREYWRWTEQALDRPLWRIRFGRVCGTCSKRHCVVKVNDLDVRMGKF